ncbi:MAG: hypothetical protein NT118_13885 [Lentisphaerae bacterium]|nr:hypothetical protein [Lentisphaerota bacterium]
MNLDAGNAVVTKLTCRFWSFISAALMIMSGFLIPAVQAGAPYGDPNQPYDKLPNYRALWNHIMSIGRHRCLEAS